MLYNPSGYLPLKRLMALLYAYLDESGKHHAQKVITFCGLIASETAWARFSDDGWPYLLRTHGISKFHLNHAVQAHKRFGSRTVATGHEARMTVIRQFVRQVHHLDFAFGASVDVDGFNAMPEKTRRILGGPDGDPFYFALKRALMEIKTYSSTLPGTKVGIVIDDDRQLAVPTLREFLRIRENDAELSKRIASIAFANDEYFPQLQAADLLAGTVRAEAARRFHNIDYWYKSLFEEFTMKEPDRKLKISVRFWTREELDQLGQVEKTRKFKAKTKGR